LLSRTSNEQNAAFKITDLETNKEVYNARGNPNREVLIGRYRIEAKAPEYAAIPDTTVEIQEGSKQPVSIIFTENQSRAYKEARQRKMKTLTKSIIIPGTGQWYAGNKVKGALITVLQLATAGGAVFATLDAKSAIDNYDTARKAYEEMGANYQAFFDEKYQEVKKTHDDAVSASNLRKAALGAVAVVYLSNIIDAALTTPKVDQRPKSVSLRIEPAIEPGRFGFMAAVRF
jgi:hypothetical protein